MLRTFSAIFNSLIYCANYKLLSSPYMSEETECNKWPLEPAAYETSENHTITDKSTALWVHFREKYAAIGMASPRTPLPTTRPQSQWGGRKRQKPKTTNREPGNRRQLCSNKHFLIQIISHKYNTPRRTKQHRPDRPEQQQLQQGTTFRFGVFWKKKWTFRESLWTGTKVHRGAGRERTEKEQSFGTREGPLAFSSRDHGASRGARRSSGRGSEG